MPRECNANEIMNNGNLLFANLAIILHERSILVCRLAGVIERHLIA